MFTNNSEALYQSHYPNTEMCVDLKMFTRQPCRLEVGKELKGVITHDDEDHFTFMETVQKRCKRNPHVFVGRYITVTRRDDGTYRLNFKPVNMDKGFNVGRYAGGVSLELVFALNGLVERK